jgi:hypothetical protein
VLLQQQCLTSHWCLANSAEVLPSMECGSPRQGKEPHRTHPGRLPCHVSMALLLSSLVSGYSPYPTWAEVYQCFDAAGKTVLTNRSSQLHNCHMLSEGSASALTPPQASALPQASSPPNRSGILSPPPYVPPMPPTVPTDIQGASIGSLPAPNPGPSSSPSPPAPCARGLNPLNPLSNPPCVRSDQSGMQPSGAAPTPSP